MDPITQQAVLATAGAAGGDKVYVDDVFSTYLTVGAGGQTISNGIDLATEGGMVWSKARGVGVQPVIHDTERGINKFLQTSSNNPQTDVNSNTNFHTIKSFNTDGFTTGADGGYGVVGLNGYGNYVHWSFRKAPGFFDVVTWAGNSVSGRQIAHNLGSAPGFIMVKSYVAGTGGTGWMCYHRSLGNTKAIRMDNGTAATSASSAYWNNTDPTSTHFTVGNHEDINTTANSRSYVAYVFAHDSQVFGTDEDESIIKCGSYTNNSSQAVEVDLGFEPQWVMVKTTSGGGNWVITDTIRGAAVVQSDTGGGTGPSLVADANYSEDSTGSVIKPTSTGFKLQYNVNASQNSAATTGTVNYIYMAIRRPHKPPEVGTDVFKANTRTGTSAVKEITGVGFPPDLAMFRERVSFGTYGTLVFDRMRDKFLRTTVANSESTIVANYAELKSDSVEIGPDNSAAVMNYSNRTYIDYFFKRAPGFFDVVAYSGGGSTTKNHNLEAVPELMIVKVRNANGQWYIYSSATGTSKYLKINSDAAAATGVTWGVTSSNFTVFAGANDSNETYVSYLFATVPGISKVGSYTGTGNAINVDCGFTAGARFILIKRSDSSGDWYVWDTARGIISGNDPYLFLNDTASEVTNTDYIDPLNSGFTVTSSAPAGLNASGGTYIFLAIA